MTSTVVARRCSQSLPLSLGVPVCEMGMGVCEAGRCVWLCRAVVGEPLWLHPTLFQSPVTTGRKRHP